MKNREQLQQIIQYTFQDQSLLEKALTHNSYTKEQEQSRLCGNERLEFLGDAFLDAIIGEALYRNLPEAEEGFLTKARASLVCEKTLVQIGKKMELGQYLRMGKGEEKTGGRERSSIIADAMEAVIGAIYLDGGYEKVKDCVLRMFQDAIAQVREGKFNDTDYKSHMQEELQSQGVTKIQYILEKTDGPDHGKTFFVRLEAKGKTLGRGSGKNKKEAEQMAAKNGLERGGHVF